MKQLNSKKTCSPWFDKILVIQPIAEVYGEGNERQLCQEIATKCGKKSFHGNYWLFETAVNVTYTVSRALSCFSCERLVVICGYLENMHTVF